MKKKYVYLKSRLLKRYAKVLYYRTYRFHYLDLMTQNVFVERQAATCFVTLESRDKQKGYVARVFAISDKNPFVKEVV